MSDATGIALAAAFREDRYPAVSGWIAAFIALSRRLPHSAGWAMPPASPWLPPWAKIDIQADVSG
ncbi:MAG TPA: hypothetical protein VG369_03270 [Humibacter sp.]|nr:hypothetical protein [Humibacter sp.]